MRIHADADADPQHWGGQDDMRVTQDGVELAELSGVQQIEYFLRLYEDYGPGGANSLDGQERMKVVWFWMYWAMEQNQSSVFIHRPIQ